MKFLFFLLIGVLSVFPCNAQSYNFQQALDAFNEKDYDKALDYFSREIKDNPKDAVTYFYRATIYDSRDQNAAALSDINNSIKYFTTKDKVLLSGAFCLRGNIYLKIENYEKTFNDYEAAIKLVPDDPDIYIDRAQIYYDLNQYDKAEADYRQVLSIDEGEVQAWAGLGRNFLFQGNFGEAEKILSQLIKLDTEYPSGFYYRGLTYYSQDKYDDAIDDLFHCILLDETDIDYRNLYISYSGKNYPLSFSKVNAQISSHPEKYIWYYIRAQLFEGKNDSKAAIADYSKVLELTDASVKPMLLAYRATCYSNAGMYEQAISDYSESLSTDSLDAYNYAARGDTKRLIGNYTGAIDDFSKAITIEPRQSWFYYRRGWTFEIMKNFEKALNDYDESISLDKKYAYTYLQRGRIYESQLKNSARAKDDYLMILTLDTVVSDGSCRQYALFHLGRNEEAIAWMNKILEKYSGGGNYYDATCLYAGMNKPNEAIANLKLAFQNGYKAFNHIASDDDMDNIRNLPEFIKLVDEWKRFSIESLKTDTGEKFVTTEKESEKISIPMKSKGSGLYEVPCKINELALKLIFDTGASDISISQTEVQFMLKNGYLNNDDILGTQKYIDANGDVEIGTKILFRKVDLGGLVLKNVNASVVHNKNAPLLFGQSALSKYGKIVIDNENKVITITTSNKITN